MTVKTWSTAVNYVKKGRVMDAFEPGVGEDLRVLTARRSQPVLQTQPGISFEGTLLKLQYFGQFREELTH